MKIDAVGVTSSDLQRSVAFYQALGFEFPEFKENEDHLEPKTPDGSARLMLDSRKSVTAYLGEAPKPANHGIFAIQYDSPAEVDAVARKITDAGFKLIKEPWDAFWGQHYAVVEDPDGYQVDLYAPLAKVGEK